MLKTTLPPTGWHSTLQCLHWTNGTKALFCVTEERSVYLTIYTSTGTSHHNTCTVIASKSSFFFWEMSFLLNHVWRLGFLAQMEGFVWAGQTPVTTTPQWNSCITTHHWLNTEWSLDDFRWTRWVHISLHFSFTPTFQIYHVSKKQGVH